MADDSNRIGSSRATTGMDLLRQLSGVGASGTATVTAAGASDTAVAAASGGGGGASAGAFGPRGNRVLPSDYPLDQLDRRAARGTYLDILV